MSDFDKDTLRQRLIDVGFAINNEYLDKYVDLIAANKNTKRKKFKTQSHHIIPIAFFKYKGLEIDNNASNRVNLTHLDHIFAHYYLSKCCIEKMVYSNEYAVLYMLRIRSFPKNEDDLLQKAINVGELYTDWCMRQSKKYSGKKPYNYGKKSSIELRKKLSDAHKGKTQSKEVRQKRSEALKLAYAEGRRKRPIHSEEMRKRISKSASGKKVMHKGEKMILVKPENIDAKLLEGWALGITDEEKEKRTEVAHKTFTGKHLSEETRKHMSEARFRLLATGFKPNYSHKKYICMYGKNGTKHAYNKEDEKRLLEQGYTYKKEDI